MQSEFWSDTGPTCDGGETLRRSLLPTVTVNGNYNRKGASPTSGNGLFTVATLSPADSRASQYLLPAGVRLNVIRAGSGRISHEWFARYDRATSSWRTRQACLAPEWETCLATFPPWGLMRSGLLFRRVPLVRPMKGNGFSLLPTPQSAKAANDTTLQCSGDGRRKPNKLGWALHLLPTPTAEFDRGASSENRSMLCHTHAGGPINPAWIEHLQGFPIGWSELED